MAKNQTTTRKIEIVETDNISRSIRRIREAHGQNYGDPQAVRRAIWHAMMMEGRMREADETTLRQGLRLP